MLINEVDEFLDRWNKEDSKGFKYLDYGLFIVEYLVITKKDADLYIIDPRSTCNEKDFNYKEIHTLLCRDKLILYDGGSPYVDFKRVKTGGCTCGSWVLGKDYPHDRNCSLYRWGWNG